MSSLSNEVLIKLKRLADGINTPKYMTAGSAGMDIEANEEVVIAPLDRRIVGTGIAVSIPEGYEIQLRPRSGLAINYGITLLNAPATIDSDYRGEISVILVNLSNKDFTVLRGMRIAQMVLGKVTRATIEVVSGDLDATERGGGGLGSTGLFEIKEG